MFYLMEWLMRQEDLHVNCHVFPKAKATFTLEVGDFGSMLKIDVTGRGGNTQSILLAGENHTVPLAIASS